MGWNHSIILTCPLLLTETGRSKKPGEAANEPHNREKEKGKSKTPEGCQHRRTCLFKLLESKLASNSNGTLHGSCVMNNKRTVSANDSELVSSPVDSDLGDESETITIPRVIDTH